MNKNEGGAPPNATDADKLYEEHGPKLIIRLLTVGAYMFSVSFAAIVLSGYYIFLWHPPNSRLIHAHAAHLRADSEMDFLVADSVTAIRTNKSNKFEHDETLSETDHNRYKYASSLIQSVTENNIFANLDNDVNSEAFTRGDIELARGDEFENNERSQFRKRNIVKKSDSTIIKFLERNKASSSHEETSNEIVTMDKEHARLQATNFSTINIIHNDITMKPKNLTTKRKIVEEDSESAKKVFDYSNSENTKFIKKFFKIL